MAKNYSEKLIEIVSQNIGKTDTGNRINGPIKKVLNELLQCGTEYSSSQWFSNKFKDDSNYDEKWQGLFKGILEDLESLNKNTNIKNSYTFEDLTIGENYPIGVIFDLSHKNVFQTTLYEHSNLNRENKEAHRLVLKLSVDNKKGLNVLQEDEGELIYTLQSKYLNNTDLFDKLLDWHDRNEIHVFIEQEKKSIQIKEIKDHLKSFFKLKQFKYIGSFRFKNYNENRSITLSSNNDKDTQNTVGKYQETKDFFQEMSKKNLKKTRDQKSYTGLLGELIFFNFLNKIKNVKSDSISWSAKDGKPKESYDFFYRGENNKEYYFEVKTTNCSSDSYNISWNEVEKMRWCRDEKKDWHLVRIDLVDFFNSEKIARDFYFLGNFEKQDEMINEVLNEKQWCNRGVEELNINQVEKALETSKTTSFIVKYHKSVVKL